MQDKAKSILPISAAVILGIVSVVIINRYISAKTNVPEVRKLRVIVAAQNIQAAQPIAINQLDTKELPENAVSDVNIVVPYTSDPARNFDEINKIKTMVAGRQASRSISAGSPLFWTDLKEVEAQALSDLIAKDKRAVTIPVDQIASAGFNITAGDKVDIIATRESGCGDVAVAALSVTPSSVRDLLAPTQQGSAPVQAKSKTFVVMQNVLVLAVGQDYNTFSGRSAQARSYGSVTLEVSLEEAMMLVHARSNATLSLVLRNPSSTDRSAVDKLPEIDCDNIRTAIIPKLDRMRSQDSQGDGAKDAATANPPQPDGQTPKQ